MDKIMKKRIEEAVEKHSFKYLSQDRIEELELGCHYEAGFIDGAQWRINSVWHDAEEEPKQNAWFIAQIGDGAFDTFIMQIDSSRWDRWCNGLNIKRWAYIDDLLPERKEENNG